MLRWIVLGLFGLGLLLFLGGPRLARWLAPGAGDRVAIGRVLQAAGVLLLLFALLLPPPDPAIERIGAHPPAAGDEP